MSPFIGRGDIIIKAMFIICIYLLMQQHFPPLIHVHFHCCIEWHLWYLYVSCLILDNLQTYKLNIITFLMSYLCYYVSPSNEGRHIVLVWFFLPLPLPQLLLLLSEATIIFLSFQMGQLYLVCGCMTIRWCVAYRNDLPLTWRSNNCFLNSIFLCGP